MTRDPPGARRNAPVPPPPRARGKGEGLFWKARLFFRTHGKKLWWFHTLYALGLGVFVVLFAQKGFDNARWLAVTLGVAWLLVVAFFRVFGKRALDEASPTHLKIRFYAMTYALKNLYQGMLFFLLPFYWKASTPGALNFAFVVLLGACALVSTVDLLFDRVLMRFRFVASVFHAITLFGCMNLIIPALLPNTRTLWTLGFAAALTVIGFFTIHLRLGMLRDRRVVLLLIVSVAIGVWTLEALRRAIPPVPMYLSDAAVGPLLLPDGRLAMKVTSLHASALSELIAVTDVVVPGGKGDRMVHVWRRDGREVYRAPEAMSRVRGPFGSVRLRSTLAEPASPTDAVGSWYVDVETDDGQLVGRVRFSVVE